MINSLIRPSDYSSESGSSSSSVISSTSDGLTLRNVSRQNMELADEYGFKLRGDSPVIIAVVVPNSLADVSFACLIYLSYRSIFNKIVMIPIELIGFFSVN